MLPTGQDPASSAGAVAHDSHELLLLLLGPTATDRALATSEPRVTSYVFHLSLTAQRHELNHVDLVEIGRRRHFAYATGLIKAARSKPLVVSALSGREHRSPARYLLLRRSIVVGAVECGDIDLCLPYLARARSLEAKRGRDALLLNCLFGNRLLRFLLVQVRRRNLHTAVRLTIFSATLQRGQKARMRHAPVVRRLLTTHVTDDTVRRRYFRGSFNRYA